MEPCNWVYDIPQGFSCVVGAKPNECSGENDRYVPVDCNEIVLKVARKVFNCNGDSDCFEGVNIGAKMLSIKDIVNKLIRSNFFESR